MLSVITHLVVICRMRSLPVDDGTFFFAKETAHSLLTI